MAKGNQRVNKERRIQAMKDRGQYQLANMPLSERDGRPVPKRKGQATRKLSHFARNLEIKE